MGRYGSIQLGAGRSDKAMAGDRRYKITRNDENGKPVQLTKFEDREEQVEAMMVRDEDGRFTYDTDPVYRETVNDLSAASTFNEPTLSRLSPIPDDQTFLAGLKRDALIQRRNELVEKAGGNDAVAKLELAEALMSPEFREAALELEAATEQPTPWADMLKARKAAGEGPLAWSFAVDEATAHPGHGETTAGQANSDGDIITVDEG